MKRTIAFLALSLVLASCKDSVIEKPDNLIAEDKMIDILTDVTVLEAVKVENPASLRERNILTDQYIFKKYKIDSAQFSKSNKYYAADANKYMKMYEKVTERITKKMADTDALIEKGVNVGTHKPKEEVVKPKRSFGFNGIGKSFRK